MPQLRGGTDHRGPCRPDCLQANPGDLLNKRLGRVDCLLEHVRHWYPAPHSRDHTLPRARSVLPEARGDSTVQHAAVPRGLQARCFQRMEPVHEIVWQRQPLAQARSGCRRKRRRQGLRRHFAGAVMQRRPVRCGLQAQRLERLGCVLAAVRHWLPEPLAHCGPRREPRRPCMRPHDADAQVQPRGVRCGLRAV